MNAKRWQNGDIEALGATYQPLRIEGRTIGGLVTLGHSVVFYTEDPRAARFDGRRFASVAEARRVIAQSLARPEPVGPRAAGSR